METKIYEKFGMFTLTKSGQNIIEIDWEHFEQYWTTANGELLRGYEMKDIEDYLQTGKGEYIWSENYDQEVTMGNISLFLEKYTDGSVGITVMDSSKKYIPSTNT